MSMNGDGDIRTLRLARKMAQSRLASKADISPSALSRMERGFREPTAEEFQRIGDVLGVPGKSLSKSHLLAMQNKIPGEGYTTVSTKNTKIVNREKFPPKNAIRVLDLFCGCGGLSYGLEQDSRFSVTAGLDLLDDRVETFHKNHPYATAIKGDIRTFPRDRLQEIALEPDVIVGGPPCQGFSSIRPFRTLTEGDPRNSLVEEFVIVVGEIRPKWFIFENVVGLLNHKKGEVFSTLVQSFKDAGYGVDWRVINMASLGLPQARERLIIVGSRESEEFPWPSPTHYYEGRSMAGRTAKRLHSDPLFVGQLPPAITVKEAIGDLPPVKSGESVHSYDDTLSRSSYGEMMRGSCAKLTMHESTRHSDKMMEIIRLSGVNRSALPEGMTTSGFSSCYSRLDANKPSVTLTVNFVHPASNRCIHPVQDRALTPREGARLQSFPDAFIFTGTKAQIVKQIGNAVPPILGKALASSLAKVLVRRDDESVPRNSSSPEGHLENEEGSSTRAEVD